MDTKIKFTDKALETIINMKDELRRIEHTVGPTEKEFLEAARSLGMALATMISLKPHTVQSDGDLSLYCISDSIVFGVNYTGAQYNEYGIGSWSVNS